MLPVGLPMVVRCARGWKVCEGSRVCGVDQLRVIVADFKEVVCPFLARNSKTSGKVG